MVDATQVVIPSKDFFNKRKLDEDDNYGLKIDKKGGKKFDKKPPKKRERMDSTSDSELDEEIRKDRNPEPRNQGCKTDNDVTQISLEDLQHLKENDDKSSDGEYKYDSNDSEIEDIIKTADAYNSAYKARYLPNGRYQCGLCGKDYQQKPKVHKHQRSVHPEFCATRSDRSTKTAVIEKKLKNGVKYYQCHICPQELKKMNPEAK